MANNELCIIVVEDEPTTRMIVEKMLRSAGHDVTSAKNGAIALRKIEKAPEKFDVVLSDVQMPKMGGMELLTRMRSHENAHIAKTIVVMMSSAKDAATSYRALKAGADDFILKPVRKGAFDKFGELVRVGHVPSNVDTLSHMAGTEEAPAASDRKNSIQMERDAIVEATRSSAMSSLVERARHVVDLAASTNADESLRLEVDRLRSELDKAMQSLLLSSSASPTASFVELVEDGSLSDPAKQYLKDVVGDPILHSGHILQANPGQLYESPASKMVEAASPSGGVDAAGSDSLEQHDDDPDLAALYEVSQFDVWSSSEDDLFHYAMGMFRELNLLQVFGVHEEVLEAFIAGVKAAIPVSNPYHTWRHTVEVMQLVFWILTRGEATKYLDPCDVFGVMLAALTFQMGHIGRSNAFHIATGSDLAVQYNGRSVNEQRAASLATKLMSSSGAKILENATKAQAEYVQSMMVMCILSTDLKRHPQLLSAFNLVSHQFDAHNGDHRRLLCKIILKASLFSLDIRPFTLAKYWSDMMAEETAREASDLGSAPPLSSAQTRIATLDYISTPLFTSIGNFLPTVADTVLALVETNRYTWQALADVM